MCGRFTQAKALSYYMEDIAPVWRQEPKASRAPVWNLAPSALAWTIRIIEAQPTASLLKWGFTQDSAAKGMAPINARVETAANKYMFKDSWNNRRCIVPADGWYEWKAEAEGKQPYYFVRSDGHPIYFAGLWTGRSFCLFTTAADGELTVVHDRKPLALEPALALDWISKGMDTQAIVSAAVPASAINFHPVSKAVSNWRNNHEALLNPL